MSTKGVIFDLDGTLADTLHDLTDAVNAGLVAVGFAARSLADVRGWIGEGLPILCRRAVDNAPGVDLDWMAAVVTDHYRNHRLDKTTLYPGIAELLDELTARRILLAILTNKPHEHTAPMADELFSRWSFIAVEGYREEGLRKPDPRGTLAIVARMRLDPAHVFFVGDSATDVHTALGAGVIPVGATWGYRSREEIAAAGVEYLIDHPSELLPILDAG